MTTPSSSRADTTTMRAPVPEQIVGGRYKLLDRLGSGGMGLVFLGEQLGVGNRVAVKVLDPEPADETRVTRFLREGRVTLDVAHPGAAQLLDLGRDDRGFLYLIFEYIDGQDLRELLRDETRLSFEEARTVVLKVAEVLAFAHTRGIVHRDVKPENIRIRRDLSGPHVKVLDFGIARLMHDQGIRLTAEGELAGTPRYMAPEQIRDGPVDARTDIYALGLVLFEVLSGRPAFEGHNMSQVLIQQVQNPVRSLREVHPDLDAPAVDALIAKSCAKPPQERYQTMEDFARALLALTVPQKFAPPPALQPPQPPSPSAPSSDARSSGEAVAQLSSSDLILTPDLVTPPASPLGGVSPDLAPTDPEREPVPRSAPDDWLTVSPASAPNSAGAPSPTAAAGPKSPDAGLPTGEAHTVVRERQAVQGAPPVGEHTVVKDPLATPVMAIHPPDAATARVPPVGRALTRDGQLPAAATQTVRDHPVSPAATAVAANTVLHDAAAVDEFMREAQSRVRARAPQVGTTTEVTVRPWKWAVGLLTVVLVVAVAVVGAWRAGVLSLPAPVGEVLSRIVP